MKYQIQTYSGSQATNGIDVVAETEGVFTETQINEWYHKVVGEKDPPDGLSYTLVPENHVLAIESGRESRFHQISTTTVEVSI